MSLGASRNRGIQDHATRIIVNSKSETLQSEYVVSKQVALQWFQRYKTFQNVRPNVLYAQALKTKLSKLRDSGNSLTNTQSLTHVN